MSDLSTGIENNSRSDEELEELASCLACAFVSYLMNTTYETACRNYGSEVPGQFWIDMARAAVANFRQMGQR